MDLYVSRTSYINFNMKYWDNLVRRINRFWQTNKQTEHHFFFNRMCCHIFGRLKASDSRRISRTSSMALSKLFSDVSSDLSQRPLIYGLALAGCLSGAFAYKQGTVRKWKKVGKVDKLYCFPMKSGKAKDCTSLAFEEIGPRAGPFKDRTFCLALEDQ